MKKSIRVNKSSGNIFADLKVPNADEYLAKAHVAALLGKTIKQQGLTQTQAATKMHLAQPDVSKLLRGDFDGFSLERLFMLTRRLGSDLEITIKPAKANHQGRIVVSA
jgi:predicted XRE-type DNA-binding protein